MCLILADGDDFYYYSRGDYGISTNEKTEIARSIGQYPEKVGRTSSCTFGRSIVDNNNNSQRTTVGSFATKKSGLSTSNWRTRSRTRWSGMYGLVEEDPTEKGSILWWR
jgi:hypothetical protein